jgi:hypothetical protein
MLPIDQNESTSAAKKASITDMLSKKTLTAEEIEQLKIMVCAATPQTAAETTVLPAADTQTRYYAVHTNHFTPSSITNITAAWRQRIPAG